MPTVDEVRQFVKLIPDELKKLSFTEITKQCNYFFPSLPLSIVDFDNKPFYFRQLAWGGTNVIYRGRPIRNPDNKPHPNISDISYIKEKDLYKIKNFGRVNKIGESMFYGSLNFATACIETLSKGEDFKNSGSGMVEIGIWKFEQPLRLVQVPHSIKYWKLFNETISFKSEKLKEEHITDQNEKIKRQLRSDLNFEIMELFSDGFARFNIENDSDYFLSNYYADRIFNRIYGFGVGEDIDGIIYPSIPNSYQEKNIVLKPSVVDTKLKFIEAMQVWCVHFMDTGGGAQFIPIEQRVKADDTGNLLWRYSVA